MLRDDVRIAMPPAPFWFNGKETFVPGLQAGLDDAGEWRLRRRSMPTGRRRWRATSRRRATPSSAASRSMSSGSRAGLVAEITTFGAALFPEFGLPPTL